MIGKIYETLTNRGLATKNYKEEARGYLLFLKLLSCVANIKCCLEMKMCTYRCLCFTLPNYVQSSY